MAAENNLVPFQRAQGASIEEKVEELQTNLERCLEFITKSALIEGVLLEGVQLLAVGTGPAGANIVNHKLGRTPRGVVNARKSVVGNAWSIDNMDSKSIAINVNADETVSIWVF